MEIINFKADKDKLEEYCFTLREQGNINYYWLISIMNSCIKKEDTVIRVSHVLGDPKFEKDYNLLNAVLIEHMLGTNIYLDLRSTDDNVEMTICLPNVAVDEITEGNSDTPRFIKFYLTFRNWFDINLDNASKICAIKNSKSITQKDYQINDSCHRITFCNF